ncbi:MAG: M48 family metallopeptidase [Cyanobacteria bacterium J06648_10]
MQRRLSRLRVSKVSTPEAFDALVRKIEVIAQRDPGYYRRRLKLLAGLGYVYIFLVFALMFFGLWHLRNWLVATQSGDTIGQFNMVLLLIALGFVSLFFVPIKPPKGVLLTREQVPELFAALDELSTALKAPKLHTVILNDDLNAAIMQRPKMGFIGWYSNYLLLGLPLMQALSPNQFKAVLAHELAHLCGGDGQAGAWIYRIRLTWYNLAEQFENKRGGGLFFQRFFSWYGPFFKAYSFVHARSEEYEADRKAAQLVGANHKAEALIWLHVNSSRLSKQFLPQIKEQSQTLETPPDDYVSSMLKALDLDLDPADLENWLTLHLAQRSDNASTHPCLSDRIAALGYTLPAPLPTTSRRATQLLGDQLEPLTQQLNQLWQKEQAESWRTFKQQHKQLLIRVESLKQKANPTTEERIKLVSMTYSLDDKEAALPLVESLIRDVPTHPTVNYWMGYLLIQQENEEGIRYLESAIATDPSLASMAYRQLHLFATRKEETALARRYQQQWQAHQEAWHLSLQERQKRDETTQFCYHDLPADEVQQLTEQLASYRAVKAAYLARQKVERFPDHKYYVFVIVRRYYSDTSEGYQPNHEFKQALREAIALSLDHSIHIITQAQQWQKLRQTEGACLYQEK